jgi:FixJ family two-component response regulator
MDGRELVSEARRMRSELPCLYMTGYAENAIGLKQAGDSEINFILKPFSRADLVRHVNKVLHAPDPARE